MEKTTHSLKFLKQRKFLMVLPLLVLPFLTMIFWALRGGTAKQVSAQQKTQAGLNTELPKADLKEDKFLSKFSFYEKADRDSMKFKQLIKNDPYYKKGDLSDEENLMTTAYNPLPPYSSNLKGSKYLDPNEERVYQKLAELNEHINSSTNKVDLKKVRIIPEAEKRTDMQSEDIDRLEKMMRMMKDEGGEEDPEMKQLNQLLEKILDVQHPERVKERSDHQQLNKQNDYLATETPDKIDATKYPGATKDTLKKKGDDVAIKELSDGFYGLHDSENDAEQNAILAVVHENQALVDGSIVKLRLSQEFNVNGHIIPKGQLVYGIAELNNERLNVEITAIKYGTAIYRVKLGVYDLDGLEGIYVPGAITRDVAKQSVNNAVQSIELMGLDRSFSAQAATAGVNAAKNLLTKKVKQVKVTLKGGYQLLLKDKTLKE